MITPGVDQIEESEMEKRHNDISKLRHSHISNISNNQGQQQKEKPNNMNPINEVQSSSTQSK